MKRLSAFRFGTLRGYRALLLLLLLGGSCREKRLPEPEAVPLPAELKSYTLFQPGTHWIYQDSASRQLDSVWVLSTEESILRAIEKRAKIPDKKHEYFRLRTRSSYSSIDQIYTVTRYCAIPFRGDVTESAYPCWAILRGQYLPNSTRDEGSAEIFPYLVARDKAGFLNGDGAIMYYYWHTKPLLLAGQTYENVMEITLTADASENGWPAHYYWAPGLGIVRQRVKVQGVNHTRTLVRSRILQ